jgi:hypothetical protein
MLHSLIRCLTLSRRTTYIYIYVAQWALQIAEQPLEWPGVGGFNSDEKVLMSLSCWILPESRKVADNSCRDNYDTFLDFKLSLCSLYSMFSFGYFPGIWVLKSQRFGTLCRFHLHRQVNEEWLGLRLVVYLYSKGLWQGSGRANRPCHFPATNSRGFWNVGF